MHILKNSSVRTPCKEKSLQLLPPS